MSGPRAETLMEEGLPLTHRGFVARQLERAQAVMWRELARASHTLPKRANSVALTFDDGPDPVFTPRVLDRLSELGVEATFFVVGRSAAKHPDLLRRMVDSGHRIGSHSFSHPDPRSLSARQLTADYISGRRAAEDAAGVEVRLFRPPRGYIRLRELAAIRSAKLNPWLWSKNARDWLPDADPSRIIDAVGHLTSGDVVLLHDGLEIKGAAPARDRTPTLLALPSIVEAGRSRGLSFKTLPCP